MMLSSKLQGTLRISVYKLFALQFPSDFFANFNQAFDNIAAGSGNVASIGSGTQGAFASGSGNQNAFAAGNNAVASAVSGPGGTGWATVISQHVDLYCLQSCAVTPIYHFKCG